MPTWLLRLGTLTRQQVLAQKPAQALRAAGPPTARQVLGILLGRGRDIPISPVDCRRGSITQPRVCPPLPDARADGETACIERALTPPRRRRPGRPYSLLRPDVWQTVQERQRGDARPVLPPWLA